ncbi:MAG: putative addiction module antidote protein [Deltaproteobacteria bacterium]|nr:putative addiction module antidote protein [Deltaproteobacteria bacterium]
MTDTFSKFDFSDYLDSEEAIAEYLTAILEESDSELLIGAIGDIAKAIGMKTIAENAGLGRESLYKALRADANPRFDTIMRVIKAMGVKLQFMPLHPDSHVEKKPSSPNSQSPSAP